MIAVPPGPGVVQFELAEQNRMAEDQLGEGRLKNYNALKRAANEPREDHMWDLLSQYGEGKQIDPRKTRDAVEPQRADRFIQKDEYFKTGRRFNTKKKTFDDVTGIIMEHSPQKFKTTYKDDLRQFSASPAKDAPEGEDLDADIEPIPGEHQF